MQNTFNCTQSPSHVDSVSNKNYMHDTSSLNNRNYSSSYSQKEIESDYPFSNFNFDILNCDKDNKSDEALYGGSFIWNFEDYFSI